MCALLQVNTYTIYLDPEKVLLQASWVELKRHGRREKLKVRLVPRRLDRRAARVLAKERLARLRRLALPAAERRSGRMMMMLPSSSTGGRGVVFPAPRDCRRGA